MSKNAAYGVSLLMLLASMPPWMLGEPMLAIYLAVLAVWVKPTYTEIERES